MEGSRPIWFEAAMGRLLARHDLDSETMTVAGRDLVAGRVEDVHAAALLAALRTKGESAGEIAAMARVLREQMLRLTPPAGPVLDTCGTGGDGGGTFNISTAAAFVCAAAGVPVVKHGNRAVSGKTGSADVLRELGVPIESGPAWAQRCLETVGFAFCFAPQFHPGMAHVAVLRRKLGIRTIFNLLGPLANPAGAKFQLLGVGSADLLDRLAGAVAALGTERTVIVHGADGLDEVTLDGPTDVRIVEGNTIRSLNWTIADFGLSPASKAEIQAATAADSADVIRRILADGDGPARRFVLANAAAGLWCTGAVPTLKDGVVRADEAIRNDRARAVVDRLQS